MTDVLAVANQKGGVAKTTTVHSLGVASAELGQRTLVVDLDPQACLTFSTGHDPEILERSLHDVLVGRCPAIEVLVKINDVEAAARETTEIEHSRATEEGHISELFTTFRRPLLLGIMLAGLQQVSGITPIFSFLPQIFRAAGTATTDAFLQSVLVSLVNLVFTLFALWLVDRAGRKTLILGGTTLQFVSLALVGWFYHIGGSGVAVLIFVMSFVAGHAFGNGVACWVIISEIFFIRYLLIFVVIFFLVFLTVVLFFIFFPTFF